VGAVAAAVALAVGLAGPAAYAVQTASQPHTGSIPSAGPVSAAGFGGGPGGGRGSRALPGGGPGGFGTTRGGALPGGANRGFGGGMRGGGMGGLLDASTVTTEMKSLLMANADRYTWAAAAVGSQTASGYQLATGKPVMPIGGFNGTDPSPTLAQFQQDVRDGKIHYFIGGRAGGFGGNNTGGSTASSQIAQWVTSTFTARSVGGVTVYDLTAPAVDTTA
jgi:hypothetical protein